MAKEKTKKSNKIILIVVIALVVILLLLGGVVYLMQSPDPAMDGNTPTSGTATPNATNYIRIGSTYQLDQFIVNLLTQSGRRYLKVTIALEMTAPELQNELDAKRAPIRDTINSILSSKSIDEISTMRGKDKLKEEIVLRLNEFLVDGKIRNVFFLDFAIQ